MFSLAQLLASLNNDQLPKIQNFQPVTHYLTSSASNSILIPFYVHRTVNRIDSLEDTTSFTTEPIHDSTAHQSVDDMQPVGFLRTPVFEALINDNTERIKSQLKPCWKFSYPSPESIQKYSAGHLLPHWVAFEDWIHFDKKNLFQTRNEQLHRLVKGWKEMGLFPDQLSGWRDECYSIHGPKLELLEDDPQLVQENVAFKIERAAVGLFSFLTFGVHLTAYIKKGDQYFFWIPTRSPNKPTWPSKLDNTVAGGISSGETIMEAILRESVEEASFSEEFVRSRIKPTGLISYTHRNQFGWIQPEIQYTFDLELPNKPEEEIIPKPNDGETQDFKLLDLVQVFDCLKSNQFKPNCAAVLIDFFIRHGILDSSNCKHYCFLSTHLQTHPHLPLP